MQEHGGAAAEAAITSFERKFLVDIKVDWNGDGNYDHPLSQLTDYVEEVSLDRALKGSAPEELMLVEGHSAAELVIKLGGEYNNIPLTTVFSPFNSRSPLYAKKRVGAEISYGIIVETDEGPVRYQQFIGRVRTITPNRGENSIEITALDRAAELNKPVRLAPWAVSDEHVNYGEVPSQLCYSHWVIDNCLRLCDVSPGPKRPVFREEQNVPDTGLDGVQLWVTGNGSYLPTIGYLDNPNADTFPQATTPMYRINGQKHPLVENWNRQPVGFAGLGLPVQQRYNTPGDRGIIRYWAADQDLINPPARHFMGFTLNTNGTNGTAFQSIGDFRALEVYIGMGRALEIWIGAGKVWSRRVNYANGGSADTTAKINIPTGRSHVDIHVEWDNTTQTGSRCYLRAGDNVWLDNLGSPVTSGSDIGADQIKGRVTIGQALNMSDVFYAVRNYYTQSTNITHDAWRPAKYAAVLDLGVNRFTHMPNAGEAKSAWEIITDVAAAEFGAVFFDEDGVFHFWNIGTIKALQQQTSRQLTLDDVSGLVVSDNLDSVRNIYTVQTNKKRAVMKGAVYESNDVNEFYVPARTQKKFRLFLDNILSPLTFVMPKYMSKEEYLSGTTNFPVWNENTTHGYCVQYQDINNTGLWRELHDRQGVDVRVYFTSDGFITVDVWNGWDEPIRFAGGSATDDPQAAFRFDGTEIYDDATISVIKRDRASMLKYGSQNLELSGDWYQDDFGAGTLIQELLNDSREAKPSTDAITIAGDPRLQLGDVLGISDPGGIGEGMRVQVIGISRRYGRSEGLTDELTVEMLNPNPEDLPEAPSAPTGLTATFLAPRTLQLQWNEVSNATEYKIYDEINEPNGVALDGTVLTTSAIRSLSDGTYRFKVTAINSVGQSGFSNVVEVTAPFGGETPTVDAPYQILNIGPEDGQNHFNVGIGTDQHRNYGQSEIAAGFSQNPWFVVNADGTAVQFSAPLDGATTSAATDYARSELRELNPDGTNIGFNPLTNHHWMRGKSKITSAPPTKPDVVVAQLHSGSNDAISIRTQFNQQGDGKNVLLFRINGTSTSLPKLDLDYQLGEEFEWMIELINGTINIYYNNMTTPFYSESIPTGATDLRGRPNQFDNAGSTFYFKAGCYNQSNETIDDPSGPTFAVELRELKHWHTGWPTPGTTPTPTPQVSVNAGADTTVALGSPVNRTATVQNSTASGTWTVVAAPSTAGSTDQTQAAIKYNWGQPVATEEFTYSGAPDAGKWSIYNGPGHDDNGRRRPERVTVDGSKLIGTGLANGDSFGMMHKHRQQYGKWEVRAKSYSTASSNGNDYHILLILWPSSGEWPEDGEYDFWELSTPDTTTFNAWIHYPHDPDVSIQQIQRQQSGINPNEWHNYAIEWDETGITLYVDGNQIGTKMSGGANSVRRNIQDMPEARLTVQMDNFDGTNQTPATMEVDWVRIYPRTPQGTTGTGGGSSIVGTTIGTSETLNWTPPVAGNYTLRYRLSTGQYDEFEVVVGSGGTTPPPTGQQLPNPTVRQWKAASSPSPYNQKVNAVTLDSTALAGDLLVYCLAGDKNSGTLTMTDNVGGANPWTIEVSEPSSSVSLYIARKVAVGGEKTITGTITGTPVSGNAWAAVELQQSGTPAWGVSAKSVSATDESTTSSKSTGTTDTIDYRGLSIAVAAIDSAFNMTDPNFSGHSVLFASPTTSGDAGGGAGLVIATAVAAPGGTTSSTFTKSGGNDQISTALVVLGRQGNAS